jgi:F-type H+-transporting ATPase subunit delta
MSQSSITYRYAKALFELAQEGNVVYPVYVSLKEIHMLLKSKEEMKIFITNPLLSVDERASIIAHVFKSRLPDLLYKFLLFLNFKSRLNLLDGIFESFDDLYLEDNNQMRVFLQTPFALKDDQKQSIQQKLNKKYHKEIDLKTEINPELLGGFRLLAAGTLFDGTIKSQLEQFRQKVLV